MFILSLSNLNQPICHVVPSRINLKRYTLFGLDKQQSVWNTWTNIAINID